MFVQIVSSTVVWAEATLLKSLGQSLGGQYEETGGDDEAHFGHTSQSPRLGSKDSATATLRENLSLGPEQSMHDLALTACNESSLSCILWPYGRVSHQARSRFGR